MFDMRAGRRGFLQRVGAALAFLWLPLGGRKPTLAAAPVLRHAGALYLCAHCLARIEMAVGAVAPRYCPHCCSTGEAWGLVSYPQVNLGGLHVSDSRFRSTGTSPHALASTGAETVRPADDGRHPAPRSEP